MMFTLSLSAFSQEAKLVLGGKNGWNHIESMRGTVYGSGRYGYQSIELDTNSRNLEMDTDLLIDFEGTRIHDVAGNYSVQANGMLNSEKSKMGKKCGLSRGTTGLRLRGNSSAMFGTTGPVGSFLIEFWLNPSIAENGEKVFSWRSSRTVAYYPLYQMIQVTFFNNKLQWEFTNVFDNYTENNGEITLSSSRTIIPNRWNHHSISYDQETGLLEYRIDGKLEALRYITTNGRELGGTILQPVLGVAADIDICPSYSGLIDDFRIQRTAVSQSAMDLRYDAYKKDGGRFETEPLLMTQGATLNRIDAIVTQPAQTDVMFYVRSGDNHYNWTDEYPEWIPVTNHKDISGVSGLYFQLAAELYPDGGGKTSPSVSEIAITYTKIPDPLPPFTLVATPGDGSVTLTWSYSVDDTAGGYYVYYGERPGEYICADSSRGRSPIDVGNTNTITLTGLKNGKIYYFAVASYSRLDRRIMGILSSEVYARPLRK